MYLYLHALRPETLDYSVLGSPPLQNGGQGRHTGHRNRKRQARKETKVTKVTKKADTE